MTAEARATPTPDTAVVEAARQAFEAWAQEQGEPYRDVQVVIRENDGYFAVVEAVAWFRPGRAAPWEEREAQAECRRVGAAWQCDEEFTFRLTAGEQAQRAQQAMDRLVKSKFHPAWTSYTNGNFVTDLPVQGEAVCAATKGGVVRWDARTGRYVKITSEYGLAGNFVLAIAAGPVRRHAVRCQISASRSVAADAQVWRREAVDRLRMPL